MKSTIALFLLVSSLVSPVFAQFPSMNKINNAVDKQKAKTVENTKNKAAESANKAVEKTAKFQMGPPMSNQIARIAKEKGKSGDAETAKGKFFADCAKKKGKKDFICMISPEVELRK